MNWIDGHKDLNGNFNLKDCCFGAIELAKSFDSDKYSYSGYVLNLILVQFFQFQILIRVKILFLE